MTRFRFGAGSFDPETRELTPPGEAMIELKPKNAQVLELLLQRRETVVSREVLFQEIWPDVVVSEQALNKVINELRNALKDKSRNSTYIKTYTKKGYRWIYPQTAEEAPPQPEREPATPQPPAAQPLSQSSTTNPAPPSQTHAAPRPAPKAQTRFPAIGALLLISLAALFLRQTKPKPHITGKPRLALLPVLNQTNDPAHNWVELGLRDVILQTIETRGAFESIDLQNLQKALTLLQSDTASTVSEQQFHQLQDLLPIHWLVQPSISRQDGTYVLSYHLISKSGRESRQIKADSLLKCGNLLAYHLVSLQEPDAVALQPQTAPSRDAFVNATYAKGVAYFENRQLDKAINHFEVCLDNEPRMAWAKLQLARAWRLKGDLQKAAALYSEVDEDAQILRHPILEAQALRYLGLIARQKGDWEQALSYSKRSLTVYESLDHLQGRILAGNQIATIKARMQELDQAETTLRANWRAAHEGGDKILLSNTGLKLATVLSMQNKIGEAETLYFEVLALYRRLKDQRNEAAVLENLGNIQFMRGDYHHIDCRRR